MNFRFAYSFKHYLTLKRLVFLNNCVDKSTRQYRLRIESRNIMKYKLLAQK